MTDGRSATHRGIHTRLTDRIEMIDDAIIFRARFETLDEIETLQRVRGDVREKGDWQGKVYMPLGFFGLMVISYFGKVADRSKRALYVFISALETLTLAAYVFSNLSTTGCFFLQVIRKAHAFTTSQQVSNTPFHFFSSADQHRSMRLYLL